MAISSPITISADASYGGTPQLTEFVGDSAPAVAADGNGWWDSSTGRSYIRYNDGSSTQWVEKA